MAEQACIFCGKRLTLFHRYSGDGRFCSAAHRRLYQDEMNRLAVESLAQSRHAAKHLPAIPDGLLDRLTRAATQPREPDPPMAGSVNHLQPSKARETFLDAADLAIRIACQFPHSESRPWTGGEPDVASLTALTQRFALPPAACEVERAEPLAWECAPALKPVLEWTPQQLLAPGQPMPPAAVPFAAPAASGIELQVVTAWVPSAIAVLMPEGSEPNRPDAAGGGVTYSAGRAPGEPLRPVEWDCGFRPVEPVATDFATPAAIVECEPAASDVAPASYWLLPLAPVRPAPLAVSAPSDPEPAAWNDWFGFTPEVEEPGECRLALHTEVLPLAWPAPVALGREPGIAALNPLPASLTPALPQSGLACAWPEARPKFGEPLPLEWEVEYGEPAFAGAAPVPEAAHAGLPSLRHSTAGAAAQGTRLAGLQPLAAGLEPVAAPAARSSVCESIPPRPSASKPKRPAPQFTWTLPAAAGLRAIALPLPRLQKQVMALAGFPTVVDLPIESAPLPAGLWRLDGSVTLPSAVTTSSAVHVAGLQWQSSGTALSFCLPDAAGGLFVPLIRTNALRPSIVMRAAPADRPRVRVG